MPVRRLRILSSGLPGLVWIEAGSDGFSGILRGRRWMLYDHAGVLRGSAPDLGSLLDQASRIASLKRVRESRVPA